MQQHKQHSIKAVAFQNLDASKPAHAIRHVAHQYIYAPIPSSLNWLFSLGFKLGILVLLKSSLILIYLSHQLTLQGSLMILSQVLVGLVLVCVGVNMQLPEMYEKQKRLLFFSSCYGYVALVSLFICWLCKLGGFRYFRGVPPKNWFVDFFTGLWSGIKEVGLSILFADHILWIMLCLIMFGVAYVYLCAKFGYTPAIIRLIKQGIGHLTAYIRHPAP